MWCVKHSVVVQVARRAWEWRQRASTCPVDGDVPDEAFVNLALRWADLNISFGSELSCMLRDRLRDVIFNASVGMLYPGRGASGLGGTEATLEFLESGTPSSSSPFPKSSFAAALANSHSPSSPISPPSSPTTTSSQHITGLLLSPPPKQETELVGLTAGLEPLREEVRSLAKKVSRLGLVHMNAFLGLYEGEQFLAEGSEEKPPS